jgi:ABC-type oligopeptide transport system substrate-binding subunit
MLTRFATALLFASALALSLAACGGGGSSSSPGQGAIQVLNNTGQDLTDVSVWQAGNKVASIGGGLVLGGSWTFSNLPAGTYDVNALTPGVPFGIVLHYLDNVVISGQTTNLTMTP